MKMAIGKVPGPCFLFGGLVEKTDEIQGAWESHVMFWGGLW